MPNRIVREGILTSERVDCIAGEPATEVFYRRLHSVVDDYGRFTAHPSLLRAALYPLRLDRITDGEVAAHLEACRLAGLIRLYRVDEKPYLEVLDFRQKKRAMRSKFPDPGERPLSDPGADDQQMTDTCGSSDQHVTSTCGAHDQQTTGICGSRVGHLRTEARGEKRDIERREAEAQPRAGGALPLDEFFEERYSRHPKKRDRILAEQALARIPGIGTSRVDGGKSVIDRAIADWRRGTEETA
jgi:hypothetical protein